MKNRMGCKSNIVSTDKDLENVPKRFRNVGRVCFDCKSNIVATAKKE